MRALTAFLPLLILHATGCAMVLRAGRIEAGGGLVAARAGARRGGFLAAVGALASAAGAAALPGAAPARLLAAGLMLASGLAALLAGLSGKPRPTGWAAAALLLAGAVVAVVPVR